MQVFTGGFDSADNTPGPKTHHHEQKAPPTTAPVCQSKAAADNDRKSRDLVGDDDVKQSPREFLSLSSVYSAQSITCSYADISTEHMCRLTRTPTPANSA